MTCGKNGQTDREADIQTQTYSKTGQTDKQK